VEQNPSHSQLIIKRKQTRMKQTSKDIIYKKERKQEIN
jgi:hypothetical protein